MRRYAWLLALGLASCAVGPKYRPETPDELNVPAAWHASLPENAKPGDLSKWWKQLGDPLLSEFIEEALKSSPTMDSARARLREARAQRGVAEAELYPTVNATGSGRTSKTGDEAAMSTYQAGFDASWELDIFGGTRRSLEASTAELETTVASLHDAQVSLAAEVALEYVSSARCRPGSRSPGRTWPSRSETREIAGWRYQAGLVSGLDFEQARAAEAQTRAQIPRSKQVWPVRGTGSPSFLDKLRVPSTNG